MSINMKTINYSFIIPHKNSPELLKRCINSIPHRKDIQIIIVDDNSDESKVDFNHFPGLGDACTEIYFTKEGKGAGYARNIGLEHAKGKWLLFADADDYYANDFINTLDTYINKTYDIIYFNTFCKDEQDKERDVYITDIFNNYINGVLTKEHIKFNIWVPWNKMFLKSFIQKYNIKFEEIEVGNDALFSLKASNLSTNTLIIEQKLYCYIINSNSITFRNRDLRREILYLDVNLRINKFLREINCKKLQTVIITPKNLYKFYKNHGFKGIIQYLSYIIINDSLLSNLGLYLTKKISHKIN